MNKIYAQVGSFNIQKGSKRGIRIFSYEPESGELFFVGEHMLDINAGQRAYHPFKDVCYITHENNMQDGGAVYAFRLNRENGEPEWIGSCKTLSTLPTDICLTSGGTHLIVPHHITDSVVTKTVRNEDGSYSMKLEGDDSTVVLISLKKNGAPDKIVDVSIQEPERNENGEIIEVSELHSCSMSPDGTLYVVCDTGLDKIISYHIDEKRDKLIEMCKTDCNKGSSPRYSVFHPNLQVLYQNNETMAYLNVWSYDSTTGVLNLKQKIGLLDCAEECDKLQGTMGASDLVVSRDGKNLYAALRGANVISCYEILPDGMLKLLQVKDCGGNNPRGLCLSPDERYLFVTNRNSNLISCFFRNSYGEIEFLRHTECELPCNLQFI